jgi:hypothetical protein
MKKNVNVNVNVGVGVNVASGPCGMAASSA